jgi:periplasmic copper chaperone A
MNWKMNRLLLALALLLMSLGAHAAIEITDARARATAPGQEVGAAYLSLKSDIPAKLLKVESPAADSVEIHEMSMNNGVMKMRMLDTLDLPAGKLVKLEPGGFHLMLIDLKKPLKAGEVIEISLTLKDRRGKTTTQKVRLPVKAD